MTRLRVMTYNVRLANPGDGHDRWLFRRDGVTSLVRFHAPDIVGFQEPRVGQREDLRESLSEYTVHGRGRLEDGSGEGCPIAVRSDRWQVRDHDTFWLSETPERPGPGWDASHPRIVTWARIAPTDTGALSDLDADALTVFNTHLDHRSARARRRGAAMLADRLATIADGTPVVVLGDLNCRSDSRPSRILRGNADRDSDVGKPAVPLVDAVESAPLRHGPTTSLTDFRSLITDRRIDHVLVSTEIDAEAAATIADLDDRGRFPSDHLPVLVRLRL
ncbi:endonuclease/exonuclease/phosphatase family protein [Halopenitus sp. H-Gu1]|uniref:endonuclease/exonuclease/phosphatase family protein n=1 Tax=Halopenitus sp. H-Gu1 TaxID=3242697 RepID=UPI00359E9CC1